jgi:hypothetical protein
MGMLRQNLRVSLRALILGLVLLPLGLAGCSVEWSLAATESEGRYEVVLPSCTIESIASVSLVQDETEEVVWMITAVEPVTGQREIVIGEVGPGFREVTPLLDELVPGVTYTASVNFSGPPGPGAGVTFTTDDLADDALWFDYRLGTRDEFESAASETGLCGGEDVSIKGIFWSKFGLGCLVSVLLLVFAVLVARRLPFGWAGLRARPPAGWYHRGKDGVDTLRWWDGARWTDHVVRAKR